MQEKSIFHTDPSNFGISAGPNRFLHMGWITGNMPSFAFSGDSKYMTPLCVSGNGDLIITDSELRADKVDPNHHKIQDLVLRANKVGPSYQNIQIQDKIIAALKLLTFREPHILVQFWSPYESGEHQYLTTINQPFGLGVNDEGPLRTYRKDSEGRFFIVDKDHEEEEHSPAARVFRRRLPEWTSDLDNYTPKQFLQQECAIRCNLHGYLALPVFYLNRQSCVGVLELLTASKYTSYSYEVQQIHMALKTQNLISPQRFDFPPLYVPNEQRQNDYDKIHHILKTTCDIHNLPLAQTWAVSQHASFVSHENVIQKSCNSFDTRCVGKVCMSTAALPFRVKDLRMWPFREACRERHLDRSRGFVGKALSSRGSSFCGDVTKLSEEEYLLVRYAHMHRLTSCFAVFLHSVETNDDYVLEFFLQPDIKDSGDLLNLVQTLKQNIDEVASEFELGESSCIQVVGPPAEFSKLSKDPHTIQISSITTANNNFETLASDSESIMVNVANKTESSANVSNQWQSKQSYPGDDLTRHNFNVAGTRKTNKMISYPIVSMQKKSDNDTGAGETNKSLKQGQKCKINSLTMETVQKHIEKPTDEAAKSLDVSRSTSNWPLRKHSKKTVHSTNSKLSQKSQAKKNLQRPSNILFGLSLAVFLMIRVKRWSCSIKSHGFSGKWWSCGRHHYLPSRSDCIYQAAHLFVQLKRWRNKKSTRNNALHNDDHPAVSESTAKPKHTINIATRVPESVLVLASPKQTTPNISDIKMVTVKATFEKDIIKFQFPNSSGLLDLEHEVAQRIIKLKGRRLSLKYIDEDNDLILLACDADLHNLLAYTAHNSTIRLIIQMADD